MMLSLSIILVAGAVAYVVYPLLRPRAVQTVSTRSRKLAELNLQKEAIYSSIRDVDFDFRMGKLPQDEHDRLIRDYKIQAASILAAADRLTGDQRRRGEPAVVSGPAGASAGPDVAACPDCGAGNRSTDSYCAHCGRRLCRG